MDHLFVKRINEAPMLEFHHPTEQRVAPERIARLLQEFKETLQRDGMASIDEYGDMLKWGLPKEDGVGRSFHVFHPDFCSYGDTFYGTIHYHGGWIRGTVLAGGLEHIVYHAEPGPSGDRFHEEQAYSLTGESQDHGEGSAYALPAMVPHWVKPRGLTITLFEEEDNERMGDLINPASSETDEHVWEQPQAEALLPDLLDLVDARLARVGPQARLA